MELIHRLRHCGIDISDRRAVRLQRLIAASALMCGRSVADLSDLWILRYIWDTMDQVEILAKIVNDVIQSDRSASSQVVVHSRARGADLPDPETISRDLKQIEEQLQTGGSDGQLKSWLRDRISILLSRLEWIPNEESRVFLRDRAQALLKRVAVEST